ncbi:MAG: hypothetical protein JWP21_2147, partial [Tardiphaga sp.]|nr:hypothetical protein [Tardiphaga sp.]
VRAARLSQSTPAGNWIVDTALMGGSQK